MQYEECQNAKEVQQVFNRNASKIAEAHKDGVLNLTDANDLFNEEKNKRDLAILKVEKKG